MRRMHGVDYPSDRMCPNKKAIRIKVKLPSSDRRLFHWPAWSRKRMSRQWLDALHKAGGPRWRTWYIYFGVVPPSDFLEVLRSEEHTSELQSLMRISYAVFCLKKKTHTNYNSERQRKHT